jgi:hypothetical protein
MVWWLCIICAPLHAAEPTATTAVPPAAAATPKTPTKAAAAAPEGAAKFSEAREAAIAKVLTHRGIAGEVVSVPSGDKTFLALLTAPPKSIAPQGAVLLLPHVQGAVSDPLVLALAAAPPASGWLTMVMQPPAGAASMPADSKNVLCARITASLKFLQARGALPVVLLGVGRSFELSRACFGDQTPAEIEGLVGLGRWQGELTAAQTSLLDIPPTADPIALRSAQQRATVAATRAQSTYRQIQIDALDERFDGAETEIAKRLRGWLIQLPRKPQA